MIAHILDKPSRTFAGVQYNTNKVDRNTGELMLIANFGPVQAYANPRPKDLVNYLVMIAAQNKKVSNTQFHAVLSAQGHQYSKQELTKAAVGWLKEMGYGAQPYLVVFHKDTGNNHVHVVSSRIDRQGKHINRDYEKIRAVRNLDKVLGYTPAMDYRFSTRAQFYLILETTGSLGRDYLNEKKLLEKIGAYRPDRERIAVLKDLLLDNRSDPDFVRKMKADENVDIVFHASGGKQPYGYSVVDHATRQVFKGSEILSLKYLLAENLTYFPQHAESVPIDAWLPADQLTYTQEYTPGPVYIRPVSIAGDIDDEGVLGRNRRRKKKARTNTR
uniref:relaxase/mobilization nuclease domain-containing protein n=1 Tax=Mucilaginibacter sp. Bleaf8 TaxID=2834430 RepID=UPI001BCDFB9F|nr:relaxase/mobilization nuclease domain-containing protein [Mucilaginibacter sp. Bleaf8]